MAGTDKIALYFEKDSHGLPSLVRTELHTERGETKNAMAKEKEGPGAFKWNIRKGKERIFALGLVRAARLVRQEGEETASLLRLFEAEHASSETRRCTETRFYDLTTYDACVWLASILSAKDDWPDGKRRFCRWFRPHNMRGKDSPGPPSIDLDCENLRPEDVEIVLDGQIVGPATVDWIESVLAAHIDSSFPPYLVSERHKAAGFMPSVGPNFGDRENELRKLNSYYADLNCALVEIVSESGFGKTALARWWMRQLFRDNSMQEVLVLSWSFPRQGRTDGTRQSLSPFFRALGSALGVALPNGLTPRELADYLLAGIRQMPTFLFLDGVEALLNQLGEFSIGGERREMSGDSKVVTFHYDSLLYLLRGITAPTQKRFGFLLVTSRLAVGRILEVSGTSGRVLALEPFPAFAYSDEELEREVRSSPKDEEETTLREAFSDELKAARLRKTVKPTEGVIDYPMAAFQRAEVSRRLRCLVRMKVEKLGISAERCLLFVACCFDQEADWDAIMHVIRSNEGAGKLTKRWENLIDAQWSDIFESLLEADLILPTGGNVIALHASVQHCVYEDFRRHMPEECGEVHRRLYTYFSGRAKKQEPDNIEDMEPLFRACWHGCNAGDFQNTYKKVAYDRISRKWQAYVVFQLCEYEETLQVLNLFTEDGETFPASDLLPDSRTEITHGLALCLRYVDHLADSDRVERKAWEKSMESPSKPQLGAIASNLLRLHHIFGDLGKNHVSAVLWSLLRAAIPSIGKSAEKEAIPKSFVPQAIGYTAGIAALIQACKAHRANAKAILITAWASCKALGCKNHYLMPGLGAPHHALALLQLGDWQTVLNGVKAGELDVPMARYVQTGAISYIKGCALAASSTDRAVRIKGLSLLEECAEKAKDNFKWWRASAMLQIGKIKLRLTKIDGARSALEEALKLATQKNSHFKLIEIDTHLGLADLEATVGNWESARAHAQKALARLEQCGYEARRGVTERFLRA